ncbi:glycosyltransferase [Candidatus Woesearchaeota archaeon]|nr:glycosyltransferase [Candidatus Woesearchaeota archaeon]
MYKIAIILPTYNSISWIKEQINSIFNQKDVLVELFISDDGSCDGTKKFVTSLSENNSQVNLISTDVGSGSAGAHFFHMVRNSKINGFDYVAFCDHDDIWLPDKLISAVDILKKSSSDGYSSDVYIFNDNDNVDVDVDVDDMESYKYSYKQRKYDHFFQTAGPGCTYVFTYKLYLEFLDLVTCNDMSKVYAHDWMIYHHARRLGYLWSIDSTPYILYRQHCNNEIGVNKGLSAHFKRIEKIRSGWYRQQILNISSLYSSNPSFISRLERFNMIDRVLLAFSVTSYRRSFIQSLYLSVLILFVMK